MAEFYSARGWEIPPLPWTNLSPPFSSSFRPASFRRADPFRHAAGRERQARATGQGHPRTPTKPSPPDPPSDCRDAPSSPRRSRTPALPLSWFGRRAHTEGGDSRQHATDRKPRLSGWCLRSSESEMHATTTVRRIVLACPRPVRFGWRVQRQPPGSSPLGRSVLSPPAEGR